ncbi:MAG: FHA domain-containing protein [Planctomycetota bacterium]|jgi:signal transduction histidine kinase
MEPSLLFFEGDMAGRRVRLERDRETLFGRGESAEVRLSDPLVSNLHFSIEERDGCLFLIDRGSRNGTFHNGERVKSPMQLRTGDVISAGQIRCEVEYGLKPGEKERRALTSPLDPLGTLDTFEKEPLSFLSESRTGRRPQTGGDSVSLLLMAQVVELLATARGKVELIERSCWIFRDYFSPDRVIVFAKDEKGMPDPLAVSGRQDDLPGKLFPAALSVVSTTLERGKSVFTHEIVPAQGAGLEDMGANLVRTVLSVPIPRDSGIWGALYMEKYFDVKPGKKTFEVPDAFSDDDFNLVSTLGQVLGLALERRESEEAILEAIEKEQRRLGQDLHDVFIQHLAGVAFISQVLEKQLRARNLAEAKHAGEITELLREAVEQARHVAQGLHPADLEREGLVIVLGDLCKNMEGMYHIPCVFHHRGDTVENLDRVTGRWPLDVQTHLYRIAQESISNAVKHGDPGKIDVELAWGEGGVTLRITDDGRGLPDSPDSGGGMGLRSMQYRAKLIGAAWSIRKGERCGTVVECVLKGSAGTKSPAPGPGKRATKTRLLKRDDVN